MIAIWALGNPFNYNGLPSASQPFDRHLQTSVIASPESQQGSWQGKPLPPAKRTPPGFSGRAKKGLPWDPNRVSAQSICSMAHLQPDPRNSRMSSSLAVGCKHLSQPVSLRVEGLPIRQIQTHVGKVPLSGSWKYYPLEDFDPISGHLPSAGSSFSVPKRSLNDHNREYCHWAKQPHDISLNDHFTQWSKILVSIVTVSQGLPINNGITYFSFFWNFLWISVNHNYKIWYLKPLMSDLT